MTTKYGTIPTSTSPTTDWSGSEFGALRPWKEMASLSFPGSFKDSLSRININIPYFHVNYLILILLVLFLSLLGRPMSLILFIILMGAWIFLYFLRDDSVIIFGCVIDERVIVVVLSIATVVFILIHSTTCIIAGILVGMAVALLHAGLTKTDDFMSLSEEGGVARMNLKETASASSSTSFSSE